MAKKCIHRGIAIRKITFNMLTAVSQAYPIFAAKGTMVSDSQFSNEMRIDKFSVEPDVGGYRKVPFFDTKNLANGCKNEKFFEALNETKKIFKKHELTLNQNLIGDLTVDLAEFENVITSIGYEIIGGCPFAVFYHYVYVEGTPYNNFAMWDICNEEAIQFSKILKGVKEAYEETTDRYEEDYGEDFDEAERRWIGQKYQFTERTIRYI